MLRLGSRKHIHARENCVSGALLAGLWGGIAALPLLLGAVAAIRLRPSNLTTGLIMGFGSGALVSAIAYELVPDSRLDDLIQIGAAFVLGALAFYLGDLIVDRRGGKARKEIDAAAEGGGSGRAIFLGTLLDGVPESLILGMSLALGGTISLGFLTAVLVSNLPEGIAGTTNLAAGGTPRRRIYGMWTALIVASMVAAAIGYGVVLLTPNADGVLLNAFAAGAILTMLADAMMPEAFEHGGRVVGLVTALGFIVAAVLSAFG